MTLNTRTHTVSTKVTAAELALLLDQANKSGKKPGEFYRDRLLAPLQGMETAAIAVAEVRAMRIIVCELLVKMARGEPVTDTDLDVLIRRAERQKYERAGESINQFFKEISPR